MYIDNNDVSCICLGEKTTLAIYLTATVPSTGNADQPMHHSKSLSRKDSHFSIITFAFEKPCSFIVLKESEG